MVNDPCQLVELITRHVSRPATPSDHSICIAQHEEGAAASAIILISFFRHSHAIFHIGSLSHSPMASAVNHVYS